MDIGIEVDIEVNARIERERREALGEYVYRIRKDIASLEDDIIRKKAEIDCHHTDIKGVYDLASKGDYRKVLSLSREGDRQPPW